MHIQKNPLVLKSMSIKKACFYPKLNYNFWTSFKEYILEDNKTQFVKECRISEGTFKKLMLQLLKYENGKLHRSLYFLKVTQHLKIPKYYIISKDHIVHQRWD